jgi:protein O-mannosyl-transferase
VTSGGVSPGQEIQSRLGAGGFASPTKQILLLSLLLVVATVLLYYSLDGYPFVNFDDNLYVTQNVHVASGLRWETVKWAFTTFDQGNWHPLTWLSHAADCQFFQLNPAGHHQTNLILHVLNVLLLFWVLQQATGYIGRSAMVAALFALHPINVETVVWISERKNLLSMTFFLLAMGAYRQYALKPTVSRYAVVAFFYALGLMAKPQVITLPCVLLLWDYWPLRRLWATKQKFPAIATTTGISEKTLSWLIVEKLPLFTLSVASALITLKAQRAGHAMRLYPRVIRLENAIVSYASYVKKALWPFSLSPMYPHPGDSLAKWQVFTALLLLLSITVVVAGEWRRHSYLAVGWFWFVGTLVPMIGFVQVGVQAMADRYAYLPFIGLFIMVCWGVAEAAERQRVSSARLGAVSVAALLALGLVAHKQIGYWENNVTLWSHALEVTRGNWLAENNLGGALMEEGKPEQAISHFRAAAAIYPDDPVSHLDIGFYEQQHKNWPQAIEQYHEVLKVTPSPKLRAEAYNNLAMIDRDLGDYGAARDHFQQAVNASPGYVSAWVGLGLAAQKTGDLPLAVQAYSRAIQIQPSGFGYLLLARALEQSGHKEEAQAATQQAKKWSENFNETQRVADRLLAE